MNCYNFKLFPLLHGEIFINENAIQDISLQINNENITTRNGLLWATNYRTVLLFKEIDIIDIPHCYVFNIIKELKTRVKYSFYCRDNNILHISFFPTNKSKEIMKKLSQYSSLKYNKRIICYSIGVRDHFINGWDIFNIKDEFERQDGNMINWRISTINNSYKICSTYPSNIIVPNNITDDILSNIAHIRNYKRFQSLTWCSKTGAVLLRSACFNIDESLNIGNDFTQNDEIYWKSVLNILKKDKIILFDSRMSKVFPDNLYKGFYSDHFIIHTLGLPSETIIQDTFNNIRNIYSNQNSTIFDSFTIETWLTIIDGILSSTNHIAEELLNNNIVLLQNENGINILSILSCLSQILVDPFYRTIKGLCILIEKDFIYFGHDFTFSKTHDNLYIFILFCDILTQIIYQNPFSFEYNDSILIYIINEIYYSKYGTFISFGEQNTLENKNNTSSIWSYILDNKDIFINKFYEKEDSIKLQLTKNSIIFWNKYYQKYETILNISKAKDILQIIKKTNITSLTIPKLKLPYIPFDLSIKQFQNINTICLSNNLLPTLPLQLKYCSNLKILNLSKNCIKYISQEYIDIIGKHLIELDLSYNNIYNIYSLNTLSKLKILRLNNNCISVIPDIKNLSLNEIYINNNTISIIPEYIFTMNSLKIFNFIANEITEIPQTIIQLENLQDINFSYFNINKLPLYLNISNLTSLNLSNTQINYLPERLLKYTTLKTLSLKGTKLLEIPSSINNLINLEYLDLGNNKISFIPKQVLNLYNLKYLNLQNNQLKYIPLEISKLDNLIELYLQHNELNSLTCGIGKLSNLTILNISYNNLHQIPSSIGFLSKLKESKQFDFSHNKNLQSPPEYIITKGYDHIFKYLQDLLKGTNDYYNTRIMFCGQENVGKSTLICKYSDYIRNNKKIDTSPNLSRKITCNTRLPILPTDGINITSLDYNIDKDKSKKIKINFKLSLWDFAGSKIYYTTHQFFITDRNIYIVCWNLSKYNSIPKVEYWLESIQNLAPNSPILLVGTHLEDNICTQDYINRIKEIIKNKYYSKYPNIIGLHMINHTDNITIQQLDILLQDIILNQPYFGEKIPLTYLELKYLIQEESNKRIPPIISKNDFYRFAQICNIKSEDNIKKVIQWFHKQGIIIYFHNQDTLNDIIILDPKWLIDIFATIFTTKHNFIKNGILKHSDLHNIWKDPIFPPSLHKYVYDILNTFELLCKLKSYTPSNINSNEFNYNEKSIIPSLLSNNKPKIELFWSYFPNNNEYQFGRRYILSFMPYILKSKFFIRIIRCIEPTIIWKNGMILEYNNDSNNFIYFPELFENYFCILIEFQPISNIIDITIRGKAIKIANFIYTTLENVISSFYHLTVDIYIPCSHCVHEHDYCPFMFLLDKCKKVLLDNKTTISCDQIDVNINDLIPCICYYNKNYEINNNVLKNRKSIAKINIYNLYNGEINNSKVLIQQFNDIIISKDILIEFKNHIITLSYLNYPNISNIMGYSLQPLSFIYKDISYGNLYDLVFDNDIELQWEYRFRCIIDIIKGLNYLHNIYFTPILHNNLSLNNIIINSLNINDEIVIKLININLISYFNKNINIRYHAPELLINNKQNPTKQSDIYSYGVILYEILSRKEYFGEIKDIELVKQKIINNERPIIPKNINKEYKQLIEDCWNQDPNKRPLCTTIITRLKKYCSLHYQNIYDISCMNIDIVNKNNNIISSTTNFRFEEDIIKEQEEIQLGKKKYSTIELIKCSRLLDTIHETAVNCLLYIPLSSERSCSQVWSGTEDGSIYIYSLKGDLINILNIQTSQILTMILVDNTVWILTTDNIIYILYTNGNIKKTINIDPLLCLEKVNNTIWGGSSNSYIYIFNSKTGKLKKKFAAVKDTPIYCIKYIETSGIIWIGTDLQNYSIVGFTIKGKPAFSKTYTGHLSKVNSIIEHGGNLWTGSNDKTIGIWESNGDFIKIFSHTSTSVRYLLNTHSHIWSISDNIISIWDTEYNKLYKQFEAHNNTITNAIYITENSNIWTSSKDKTIRMWQKTP